MIEGKLLQKKKAAICISVNPDGSVTDVKEKQLENVYDGMNNTLFGMVIAVKLEHSEKIYPLS